MHLIITSSQKMWWLEESLWASWAVWLLLCMNMGWNVPVVHGVPGAWPYCAPHIVWKFEGMVKRMGDYLLLYTYCTWGTRLGDGLSSGIARSLSFIWAASTGYICNAFLLYNTPHHVAACPSLLTHYRARGCENASSFRTLLWKNCFKFWALPEEIVTSAF